MKITKILAAAAAAILCFFFASCTKNETDDAQIANLTKQVDSLKAAQISLGEALAGLGLDVSAVSDTVDTLVVKYRKIDADIARLEQDIARAGASLDELTKKVDEISASQKTMFEDIYRRLGILENRVQSVVVIPDYSSGAVEVNTSVAYVNFHIRPYAVADSLVKLHNTLHKSGTDIFRVAAVQREAAETRAAIPSTRLSVDTVEFHEEDSVVMVKVDASALKFNAYNYVASLSVISGNVQKQSEYFPLKWTLADTLFLVGTHTGWELVEDRPLKMENGIIEDTVSKNANEYDYFSAKFSGPGWTPVIQQEYFDSCIGICVELGDAEWHNIKFLNPLGGSVNGRYSIHADLKEKTIAAYYHKDAQYEYLGDYLYFACNENDEINGQKLAKVDFGRYSGFIYVPNGDTTGQFKIESEWEAGHDRCINANDFANKEGVHQLTEDPYNTVFEGGEGLYWVDIDLCGSKMTAKKPDICVHGNINSYGTSSMTFNSDSDPDNIYYSYSSTEIAKYVSSGGNAKFCMLFNDWSTFFGSSENDWDNIVKIPNSDEAYRIDGTFESKDLLFYPIHKTSAMHCKWAD